MKPNKKEITIRDAITAGLFKAHNAEVIPQNDTDKEEVTYCIRGSIDEILKKISENAPVGSRDVLEGIKACRSAIYLFRGGQR